LLRKGVYRRLREDGLEPLFQTASNKTGKREVLQQFDRASSWRKKPTSDWEQRRNPNACGIAQFCTRALHNRMPCG
jgi:hypothetical protein